MTILSDPHTSRRFRQVVLVSGGNNKVRSTSYFNEDVDYKNTFHVATSMVKFDMIFFFVKRLVSSVETNSFPTLQERTFLTRGEGEVTKILSWSRDGYVYYLSTLPGDAGSRHLYRVASPRLHHMAISIDPECLSCNRDKDGDGKKCQNK